MANIKSAIKRIDVTKKATLRNKSKKSEIKTYTKKFHSALDANNLDEAGTLLRLIDKKLKKAASNNIIHKNAIARRMSAMTKAYNKVAKA